MVLHSKPSRKLFYKIGEVCSMVNLEPYTLRYWEKEFSFLSPRKNSAGQRIYSPQDILIVERIRNLLYREGYTLDGARKQIEKERVHLSLVPPSREAFDALRSENRRLRTLARELRKRISDLLSEL